jgi:hypothetical protein
MSTLVRPVGLQLSRARGFRLHQLSYATNGLPARRVDRASPFGNPFRLKRDEGAIVVITSEDTTDAPEQLVAMFRCWALADPAGMALMARARAELRGHNLACWCALDRPCHRTVLLELAND